MSPEVQEIYLDVASVVICVIPFALLAKLWYDDWKDEKQKAKQNKKAS
jgi:hypothetical protein